MPPSTSTALFPGLRPDRVRLDGPGGSLVLGAVADAVRDYLAGPDVANLGSPSAASVATTQLLTDARERMARVLASEPDRIVLGPSATALLARLATAFEPALQPGDELVVSGLEHDANVAPWLDLAARTGSTVRFAEPDGATLDLPAEAVAAVMTDRTRVVAVTAASNITGTTPDLAAVRGLCDQAAAALVVDAVHSVPHGLALDAVRPDAAICSAYKFFGPHVSAMALSRRLLDELTPASVRPVRGKGVAAWERGSLPFELLAGLLVAADYVLGLDWPAVRAHEEALTTLLLDALEALPGVHPVGRPARRTSTVAFTVDGHEPAAVGAHLARAGIAVSAGDMYAVELFRRAGVPGAVRAGLLHYNREDDVDRLVAGLRSL